MAVAAAGGSSAAGAASGDSAAAAAAVNRRLAEDIAMNSEAAVIECFDFLNDGSGMEEDPDELMSDSDSGGMGTTGGTTTDDLKINSVSNASVTGGKHSNRYPPFVRILKKRSIS